ncbi:MAG: DNA-processing protein DprA [Patescibacteria group bacterium]
MSVVAMKILNSTLDMVPSIEKFKKGLNENYNHFNRIDLICKSENIRYITFQDPQYPRTLLEDETNPSLLFYKGDVSLLSKKSVSIVGSRTMDDYCSYLLHNIIPRLNKVVVSGLASGVDIEGQMIALNRGLRCISVLPCGLLKSVIYPKSNQKNLEFLLEEGNLAISQFLPDFVPKPYTFLIRNKLMVNISDQIIVIKASEKSGSYRIGKYALEKRKSIYTSINRIDNASYFGSHQLIKEGAIPIFSFDDFGLIKNLHTNLSSFQEEIFEAIKKGRSTFDDLADKFDYMDLIENLEILESDHKLICQNGVYIITTI